jgi:hypothetical protein
MKRTIIVLYFIAGIGEFEHEPETNQAKKYH